MARTRIKYKKVDIKEKKNNGGKWERPLSFFKYITYDSTNGRWPPQILPSTLRKKLYIYYTSGTI